MTHHLGMRQRPVESRAIEDFLQLAAVRPAVLVVEGEAGIGKTTVWQHAVAEARSRGFRVLTARAEQTRSRLAYGVLADLLENLEFGVNVADVEYLTPVQRIALHRVLARAGDTGPATDERVLASAFLALAAHLSADAPVLVAIDDAQWLDASSRAVVAFGVRRLRGRVGVLVAERTDGDGTRATAGLQVDGPPGTTRLRVRPLGRVELRAVLVEHLGGRFSHATVTRIAELSGGNPFYALELARSMAGHDAPGDAELPPSLAELVATRLTAYPAATRDVLLAATTAHAPTIDLVAAVGDRTADEVEDLLAPPEDDGVVALDGNRIRFTHPLLARGVYDLAGADRRRALHARLARIVDAPEARARHLALSSTTADAATMRALDDAAASARARGAPATAAELLDLAIGLDGTDPERRMLAADHHFRAGSLDHAERLLDGVVADLPAGPVRARALNQLARVYVYADSFAAAARLVERALAEGAADPATRSATMTLLAFAHFQSGAHGAAMDCITEAVRLAEDAGEPSLLSQALAMRVTAEFHLGRGVDTAALTRALDAEDPDADVLFGLRASAVNVFIRGWIGDLDEALDAAADLQRRCVARGAENDIMAMAGHATLIDVWRGDFARARRTADENMVRAEMAGGDLIRIIALTLRAMVAAHTGNLSEVRADAAEAMELAHRGGTPHLAAWPALLRAFADVSVADYAAAHAVHAPLLATVAHLPGGGDVPNLWWVPDAVEALIGLGRTSEAEPLIAALERAGHRLSRPRLVAAGLRARAMWLAARGDVAGALRAATEAIAVYDRLPLPFERARTQLVLGQLQRRQRLPEAEDTLAATLADFERMGATAWADRARVERERLHPATDRGLTEQERAIAELVARGLTNRDVAKTLLVSPKTVEARMTQIYRKLGIRSRAQLALRYRQDMTDS